MLLSSVTASPALAEPAGSSPAGEGTQAGLYVKNVRLVGFAGESPDIKTANVLIEGGKIAFVRGGTADALEIARGVRVLEGDGMTMIPGLTDMHVHLWDEAELGAYLAYGVTTVRNMSGMPFHLAMAKSIEGGVIEGPALVTTGPILNSAGPNVQINHQIVETAAEGRAAVRWQHALGFDRIKVYSNLTRPAYEGVLAEARSLGMRIAGHTPEGVRADGIPHERPFAIAFEDVLDDGFETIEHTEAIVWHGLRGGRDEGAARALARRIADSGAVVTPTLLAHHNLWRAASEGEAFLSRAGTQWLNPLVFEAEESDRRRWHGADAERLKADDAFYARVTKMFDEEGVRLVAGSDAGIFVNVPGISLIEELALLAAAGLTPYRAIRAATYMPALVLGEERKGCVDPGCAADLVLYVCDPLADIACLESPAGVIRQGRYLGPDALIRLRKAAANTDYGRSRRRIMGALRAQGDLSGSSRETPSPERAR